MNKSSLDVSIGDLYWAKIGSYPYWPCIVTASPGASIFLKAAKKSSLIHVHFFGDNGKHSWVPANSLMAFKGLDEFNKKKINSKDPTKVAPGFNVKNNLKSAWDAAVKEIESVVKKDPSKRIEEYHILYPLKYDHGSSSKRKSVSSEEGEIPAKIVKSAPPKKAIKAAAVESLHNGPSEESKPTKSKVEPVDEYKFEPVPSKLKKIDATKKEPKKKPEVKKDKDVDAVPKSEETDLSPVLSSIHESLSLVVNNKKQLTLAKKLIEHIVRLGVSNELTDKHAVQ